MSVRSVNRPLFLCFLALGGASAQATTVALGAITAPLTWPIAQVAPLGPLLDRYTFSISNETTLVFSSLIQTEFYKYARIPDLKGELFRDGELLLAGDAGPGYTPDGMELPVRQVSFSPFGLGAGDFELRFSGTTVSYFFPGVPVSARYTGQIGFGSASAVPEPSTAWLLGLAIVALWGGGGLRRRPTALPALPSAAMSGAKRSCGHARASPSPTVWRGSPATPSGHPWRERCRAVRSLSNTGPWRSIR